MELRGLKLDFGESKRVVARRPQFFNRPQMVERRRSERNCERLRKKQER
jgi:hypothetical protein